MRADGAPLPDRLRVDGGMVRNDWLMQRLADLSGSPVERGLLPETTALGAAFLAGLGVGLYGSLEEISRLWSGAGHFEPVAVRKRTAEDTHDARLKLRRGPFRVRLPCDG